MGPGLLPGSGSHVLQIQIWAGQRPGPQNESRDRPCRRGQRSGLQGESRDHFCFVIRGQDPEVSRDHPLVGSGQDPRVKVGTTSILGGQGQGPRMRAGTTPVWGGQRSRPQGESRDTPLWPEVENLSSVCPHIPPIRPTPRKPSCGQQGSLEPQQGPRRQVPGNCGLNQGGEGHYAIPGMPARIEAMPWAGAGVVVRWSWAQPRAWHHLTCRRSRVPESPRPCPGTCRVGPSPAPLPPEPAFSLCCSALSSVSAWGRLRPLPGCPVHCPAAPGSECPARGPSLSVGLAGLGRGRFTPGEALGPSPLCTPSVTLSGGSPLEKHQKH